MNSLINLTSADSATFESIELSVFEDIIGRNYTVIRITLLM